MTVSFFVPGLPIAQERARSGHGHWYDPVKSKAWKDVISWHAQRHRLAKAGKAPISVNLVFVFPLSKSATKRLRQQVTMGAVMPHMGRCDLDNLVKAVYDACTGILWTDDRQIWESRERKQYGDMPGVEVSVTVEEAE